MDVVKQEMVRININILGISELKWTGMRDFNSDDHHIYDCGQESHKRNGVALIINKRVRNAALGCNLKNDRIQPHIQQKKILALTLLTVWIILTLFILEAHI